MVGHTELVTSNWAMPELIEAAARVGAYEDAAETDLHLTGGRRQAEQTGPSGSPPVRTHFLRKRRTQMISTLMPSSDSDARESRSTSPVPICSTASGFDVSADA